MTTERSRCMLRVCLAEGCLSSGSAQIKTALECEIQRSGLDGVCSVRGVGCMGLCQTGPLVGLDIDGVESLCQHVSPQDTPRLVAGNSSCAEADLTAPFFVLQQKIVLENSGSIDPENIADYEAVGGYAALRRALEMTAPQVVEQVKISGLRGRGGAGYPTGLKWEAVARAGGQRKFVVCNADEGDPGAFMDRSVLESDPHRVLEGMAIAARAVGACEGYIYIRAEYPLATRRLKTAIAQARQSGWLGERIGGADFDFDIHIRVGAGAYVCGEETALIASIEGGRGTPHPRPPYPAQSGLWGCPTLINNVETFANIAPILRHGGAWMAGIGTAASKGTKVFALSGNVVNNGVVEVPMGISLRDIVFRIGGGIPGGRRFKAVQTGGPSGGCIPESLLDLPVDYEALAQAGSIIGSGGMVVMDEGTCMVEVARYFMDFCRSESCGKCVPCRVGTTQMHNLLQKICAGDATLDDLHLLEELCDVVKHTSLCGLGQSAPNPVLSTLRYFREEYLAHIEEKRCPAGVCQFGAAREVAR